jgi:2,5-diketo-D-gluconate reductase A
MTIPTCTLNQGNSIPQLGFGTFKIPPEATQEIVEEALAAGYRHIDTATGYRNEAEVGAAIRASGIARDRLFVTTKLWNDDQASGDVRGAFERSLAALNIGYVDLYLIHWPMPSVDKYVETWRQLVEFKDEGLTKSIGVCNFTIAHLERIIEDSGVVPALDQVELHPIFQQKPLRNYLAAHGIAAEAWGPLAQGRLDLGTYPALADAARAHGRLVTQIVLRWHIQSGTIAIPKASSRAHMDENLGIFDFTLTDAEMAGIDALGTARPMMRVPRWAMSAGMPLMPVRPLP